jgi:molybdate transport system substrate-binding protein
MRLLAAALAGAAVAVGGCGDDESEAGSGERPRLVVSAASSMTEALEACAPDLTRANVRLQFAGSDELAAQIRQGVKPDVFAAANTSLPEELHADGLLSAPVEFATNELVVAVAKDSTIDSLDELARQDVKLAIGSASVPIGSYTRETLAKLPDPQERAILDNVRSNEPDAKGIVGKLTRGAADAGFVYVTDVEATDGDLRSIAVRPALKPTVTYGAGVVRGAERPEEAERFVDQLVEGPCADALREAGFGPPPR